MYLNNLQLFALCAICAVIGANLGVFIMCLMRVCKYDDEIMRDWRDR